MISKERLQKLIKQEATIWVKNQYCKAYDVELSHYNYVAITDNKESLMFLDYSIQEDDPESVLVDYLENLYETKEDAEWASMATYRTEMFNPPVWEYFLKKNSYIFLSKRHQEVIIRIGVIGFTNGTTIEYVAVENDFERFYTGDLTKDNYIKACTIARKLFLGESVEKGENNEESKN